MWFLRFEPWAAVFGKHICPVVTQCFVCTLCNHSSVPQCVICKLCFHTVLNVRCSSTLPGGVVDQLCGRIKMCSGCHVHSMQLAGILRRWFCIFWWANIFGEHNQERIFICCWILPEILWISEHHCQKLYPSSFHKCFMCTKALNKFYGAQDVVCRPFLPLQ